MNRRSFLKSILAAGVAPAVIGSGILMPVKKLWTPDANTIQMLDQRYYTFFKNRIWMVQNTGAAMITLSGIQIEKGWAPTPRPIALAPGESAAFQEDVEVWSKHTGQFELYP